MSTITPLNNGTVANDGTGTDLRTATTIINDNFSNLNADKVENVSGKSLINDTEITRLSNIEDNATADQTSSEIKVAYESNSNTNAFTDAEKLKVANSPADQNSTNTTLQSNIDGKANISHTHTESEITDLDKYTQAQVDAKDALKANITDILDILTSTDSNKILSANQGRVLSNLIIALTTRIGNLETLTASDESTLNTLQEIVDFIEINKSTLDALTISSIAGLQTALDGKENSFSKNTAFNKNFGSTSGTVTEGNDSRLSDSRIPTAHTHTKSEITDFSDGDYATSAQGGLADSALQAADITGKADIAGSNAFIGKQTITHSGTAHTSNYTLSLLNPSAACWLELKNNFSLGGAFFGMSGSGSVGDGFQIWNWQGGGIRFYTGTTDKASAAALDIQGDKEVLFYGAASYLDAANMGTDDTSVAHKKYVDDEITAAGMGTTYHNTFKAPQQFTASAGSSDDFTLSSTDSVGFVVVNGQILDDSEYSLSSATLTVTPDQGFNANDEVLVFQNNTAVSGVDISSKISSDNSGTNAWASLITNMLQCSSTNYDNVSNVKSSDTVYFITS